MVKYEPGVPHVFWRLPDGFTGFGEISKLID
jgi:hypothetical protein